MEDSIVLVKLKLFLWSAAMVHTALEVQQLPQDVQLDHTVQLKQKLLLYVQRVSFALEDQNTTLNAKMELTALQAQRNLFNVQAAPSDQEYQTMETSLLRVNYVEEASFLQNQTLVLALNAHLDMCVWEAQTLTSL